ncbi:MAG: 2,3-bisphosphoglycerate-independent phosphoglycerate mutase [Patescibacteria group bacterium]
MNSPLVVLIVMDGWGIAPAGPGNPILQANLPNLRAFWAGFPHTTLHASGEAVGLPRGEVGNTETGHLNLGAGRIVYQDLLRINTSIANGKFFQNSAFLDAIEHVKKNNSHLHLMGLVGGSGVHSSTEHLIALLRLCKEKGLSKEVLIQAFTDGRDSPPNAGHSYIQNIENFLKKENVGKLVSVMGRYWAMDRDRRWERTKVAYDALTLGVAKHTPSILQAIQESYNSGITDEFLNPAILVENGQTPHLIGENDAVIFFNFRVDRPKQLASAFLFENFQKDLQSMDIEFDPYAEKYYKKHNIQIQQTKTFPRPPKIKNLFFVTMTKYAKPLEKYSKTAFSPEIITSPLAQVLSVKDIQQLRLSESEKERFVTFYFDGQRELPFPGELKLISPSPKIATYDLCPEMSAKQITQNFINSTKGGRNFHFVLINFANPDMVGHTGNIDATRRAVETVDSCVGEIAKNVQTLGGVVLVTADHGNAEELLKNDGTIDTEHSTNPVPFIIVGNDFRGKSVTLQSGILADVAPTILKLMGITIPQEMTGRPLI